MRRRGTGNGRRRRIYFSRRRNADLYYTQLDETAKEILFASVFTYVYIQKRFRLYVYLFSDPAHLRLVYLAFKVIRPLGATVH